MMVVVVVFVVYFPPGSDTSSLLGPYMRVYPKVSRLSQ